MGGFTKAVPSASALAWPGLFAAQLLALLLATSAQADTVTLVASRDTTLFDESGTLSNGAGSYLFAGETNESAVRRALVAFDVASAIPPGSTITGASLVLTLSRTRTGDESVTVHRVLSAWGEAGSDADDREGTGAAAETGDATWTHRMFPAVAWTTAGGDYVAGASATTTVGSQNGAYTWTSAQMKNDVQVWLASPSSNHGWIAIGNESELKVAKRFNSRENTETATRPRLMVTFTPPASTGACCSTDGTCTIALHPGSGCSGVYQGIDSDCSPNPCPQPAGACCLPTAGATCVDTSEDECEEAGGSFDSDGDCDDAECPVVLEPFVDPLPRPAVANPVTGTSGGAATYDMAIREVSQKLHRDLPATRVWGFGDEPSGASFPGPTIEATSGVPITVRWINDLRDSEGELRSEHFLPVDACAHGAHHPAARTVVHLHGGHVPQESDGYPESTIEPGEDAVYAYPNAQLPATLWYHDHALGITRLNVYMGLAGFYLLRDGAEKALGLPSGEYEIPLAIQDRTFRSDGSLVYPAEWQEHFFGDTVLVNGKVWPFLEVKRGKYRLRVLNGSGSRTYTLSLSAGASFVQIGTDGGLLSAPIARSSITLGPGERADVVVNFAPLAAGTEVLLTNSAAAPYPVADAMAPVVPNVMKFVVLGQTGHTAPLPSSLRAVEPILPQEAVVERDFELQKGADACTGSAWFINGLRWDDIREYPELGTAEMWRFVNRSGVMHPMHMHLVMFQVLDRQAFAIEDGEVVPVGSPAPPPAGEAGWKDTVQVGPSEIVRVIARFESYKGRYAYHCHILEHEDHEMMRQFQTVSCGDGEIDPGEECDPGVPGTTCCTTDCVLEGPPCGDTTTTTSAPDTTTTTSPDTTTTSTLETTTTTEVPATTTTTIPPGPLCGDANGDDELLASDALLALRAAVGSGACEACVCDVNSSGAILASDAQAILRVAVGQAVVLVCDACAD
jgi:spore coat protein A